MHLLAVGIFWSVSNATFTPPLADREWRGIEVVRSESPGLDRVGADTVRQARFTAGARTGAPVQFG